MESHIELQHSKPMDNMCLKVTGTEFIYNVFVQKYLCRI